MRRTQKLAGVLTVLLVVAMAAPVVLAAVYAEDPVYEVSVKSGQSTTTTVNNVNFGDIFRGTSSTITDSLTLTNTGDWDAAVTASCADQSAHGGVNEYGLIGSTDTASEAVYIGGENLELGTTGNLVALTNDGSDTVIDDGSGANKVPAEGSVNYDAKLTVPDTAIADSYEGMVVLTFSNAE